MSFEATAPTDKQVTLKKAVESSISSLPAFPTCARVNGNRAPVPLWAKRALRERKLGFALVLTNCPANTRGNSGNNWRVRRTISRPFFFAAA